ncbi:hypothetical protein Q9966_013390 [Columba livia]|nr:hypothetical protein Q9966_013390 [Columba livia]
MRELCELCRISGSTLLTNSSDKGQTSSHRRNEEQDFCLLPAGSIDAISMLTSARESRNGNSPTGRRTKRKDSEAPTEKPTVLLNHLQKTKESAPGTPPSTPQVAAEPSPMPLLSAKPQKRKAADMNPGLMQRTATIGSCPVIYSQPLMATSKYQPSPVPLASLRPRQRLQSELQARPNLRMAPGAALGLQPGYLGVTAPAAPAVMSYAECAAPVSVATAQPARGALPATATATAEQPPPPPPPQTPPPPVPKAPPPPEKEKPRKGRKDKGKKGKTKMPSLVKKWQSIQRELDEEENSSSSEEDRETTAQRRIEEWKQQQLMSGMAERNANFEALPEDWRARLKRRKTASST